LIGLLIAGGLAYNVSGAERLGLVFYVLASVLISQFDPLSNHLVYFWRLIYEIIEVVSADFLL